MFFSLPKEIFQVDSFQDRTICCSFCLSVKKLQRAVLSFIQIGRERKSCVCHPSCLEEQTAVSLTLPSLPDAEDLVGLRADVLHQFLQQGGAYPASPPLLPTFRSWRSFFKPLSAVEIYSGIQFLSQKNRTDTRSADLGNPLSLLPRFSAVTRSCCSVPYVFVEELQQCFHLSDLFHGCNCKSVRLRGERDNDRL